MDKVRKRQAPPLDRAHANVKRFWAKVALDFDSGCWLWQQSSGSHGYGQTWDGTTVRLAHRVAYELVYGVIPDRLTVDHVCRVGRCCNPAHLRLLPNVVNATDNGQGRKTHCPQAHPYDEANTWVHPVTGHRTCRKCSKAAKRAQRAA